MMKGFSGEAGPRKGADQTVAGLLWRATWCIVLRAAGLRIRRTGMKRRGVCGINNRIVGVGSDVGPHFVCARRPRASRSPYVPNPPCPGICCTVTVGRLREAALDASP